MEIDDGNNTGAAAVAPKPQAPAGESSPVVHCRGLATFATEDDLLHLAQPFGTVVNVLVMSAKSQAFIQFASTESSTAFINHFAESPPSIRGKAVYFGFSTHKEITKRDAPENDNDEPNSVLLVTVTNNFTQVPVTVDHLLQVFRRHGDVLKIVTFVKGAELKALCQMASLEQGASAKLYLDGKDMFQVGNRGCCKLHIVYSKLDTVQVRDNINGRDFTRTQEDPQVLYVGNPSSYVDNPNFAGKQMTGQYAGQQGVHAAQLGGYPSHGQRMGMQNDGMHSEFGQVQNCVLLVHNLPTELASPDNIFMLLGVYGDVNRVKIFYKQRSGALVQFNTPQQAAAAMHYLNKLTILNSELNVSLSIHSQISISANDEELYAKSYTGSPIHRFKKANNRNALNLHAPSQVLHVASIHPDCTEEDLKSLFGAEAVEFFVQNRRMAFVKMPSMEEGVLALVRLNNYKFHETGPYLRVSFSGKSPSGIGAGNNNTQE